MVLEDVLQQLPPVKERRLTPVECSTLIEILITHLSSNEYSTSFAVLCAIGQLNNAQFWLKQATSSKVQ